MFSEKGIHLSNFSDSSPRNDSNKNESYVVFIGWFWKHRYLIAGTGLLFGIAAVAMTFLSPSIYTAQVTMLPQKQSSQSDLLGQVASITGMSLDMDNSWEKFYGKIAIADTVLNRAIEKMWFHQSFSDSVSLYDIFSIKGKEGNSQYTSVEENKLKAVLRTSVISFYRDSFTGFMILRSSFPNDKNLPADFANFIVKEVDNFNRKFNSQKSAEKRAFLEERIGVVETDLHGASLAQSEFLENNRSYQSSPFLVLKYNELAREVQAQTTLWIELRRQLEVARIGELNESELVSVLEWATPPEVRSKPKRKFMGIIGVFVGGILSILLILLYEQFKKIRPLLQDLG